MLLFSRSLQPAAAYVIIGSNSPLYRVRMAACPRPHFALATFARLRSRFLDLFVVSSMCSLFRKSFSKWTPRYFMACFLRILFPLILIIGGLPASNFPYSRSISVLLADSANFFLEHQLETRVTASCPLFCSSVLALPAASIVMSSAYAIGSHSGVCLFSSSSKSSNIRFQKLGRNTEPCGHPFVAGLVINSF
jgi:hypothetical protein